MDLIDKKWNHDDMLWYNSNETTGRHHPIKSLNSILIWEELHMYLDHPNINIRKNITKICISDHSLSIEKRRFISKHQEIKGLGPIVK